MSLTGTFSGTTANERITPTIAWSAVQSVAGNYSDITATLTYRRSNDYVTGGKWEGSLTVGDQTVTGKKTLRITDTEDAVAISATFRVLLKFPAQEGHQHTDNHRADRRNFRQRKLL